MFRDIWGHHNYRGYWRHPMGRGQGCYSTSCMHRTAPPTKHHPVPMSMLPGLISSTKCLSSATPGSLLRLHSFACTIASAWTCFSLFPSQGFLLILWKLILPSLSCAGLGHSLHSTFSHPGYITQCFINVCVCVCVCVYLKSVSPTRVWVPLECESCFFFFNICVLRAHYCNVLCIVDAQ